jgi:hypothetical protein
MINVIAPNTEHFSIATVSELNGVTREKESSRTSWRPKPTSVVEVPEETMLDTPLSSGTRRERRRVMRSTLCPVVRPRAGRFLAEQAREAVLKKIR